MAINRNSLKTYAPKARQKFIAAVTARAAKFGISGADTVPMQEQGHVVIIDGEAFSKKIGAQRKALMRRINLHGFGQTIEEVAYTWFNRFLAIRYMEVHGYLDHGYRVLSNPDGSPAPEILQNAEHVDLAALDMAKVVDLKLDGTKDAELYNLLLIAQCNALHESMPFLFEKIDDETELLLPDNLLHSDSLIRQLVNEIDEADWQEIEIIGWLYQFYISEKKEQVIGKVVKSEDIPAATQLFTPNWIVKYMVQNSLGHQWMATYPSSSLKEGMEYYIEPAEQTPEVQEQLAEITPKELNPEKLTLLDPAVGSGHILVEAYDLFKQIYLERGYRLKDIPRLILEKNLYGLDIDDRAAQMAGFALLMKAHADDRRILSNPVGLNVMAIQSSEELDGADIAMHLLATYTSGDVKAGTIESLINLFKDAKTFGSLITVPEKVRQALPALEQLLDQPSSGDLLQSQMRDYAVEAVRSLVTQSKILGRQYDCVVANPPYMGGKYMTGKLKYFVGKEYEKGKADFYSCFMIKSSRLVKQNCYFAMITIPNWMFLSSFEKMRKSLFSYTHIHNAVHNGRGLFGSDFGSVAFVVKNSPQPDFAANYYKLFENKSLVSEPELIRSRFFETTPFVRTLGSLAAIPGVPISYWASDHYLKSFENPKVSDTLNVMAGVTTGNTEKYLRYWFEVNSNCISYNLSPKSDIPKERTYVPYNKGGDYRKWYGNAEYVFPYNQKRLLQMAGEKGYRPDGLMKFFAPSFTWAKITMGAFSARYNSGGFGFDATSTSALGDVAELKKVILILNSKLGGEILNILNSSMVYLPRDIKNAPIVHATRGNELFDEAYRIAKLDWDFFEVSWDFQCLPMLSNGLKKSTSATSFDTWQAQCEANIYAMKGLEEENNRYLIEAYGLQEELAPDVPENQITLARADREEDIKRLISYAIGCMMGRYSLAEEGLIYANSGNEGFDSTRYGDFPVDDDGIIPTTDAEWFDDDAVVRFEEFLKSAWSPETLKENLNFIGDCLANNGSNDPLKTIRNYLSKGFYKDHLKTYKKRPIYWLFSSGKQRAFECLVYLHRYNEGTLARMRMEYVTPLQSRMSARIDQLTGDVESASSSAERNRKQKEKNKLIKQLEELRAFDEELRHYADQRITLDLDDGVKANYGKFGNLLADVKAITGKKK